MDSILIALSDSMSSKAVLEYVLAMAWCPESVQVTLLHVFRKQSGGEELMGHKYMKKQPARYMEILEQARDRFTEKGVPPKNITLKMVTEPYDTIADGIIDQARTWNCDWLVLSRVDQTDLRGKILDLLDRLPLPVSLVGDTEWPEGAPRVANSGLLADLILGKIEEKTAELRSQYRNSKPKLSIMKATRFPRVKTANS